jgi:parallel beta-helix repeat protein
MSEPLSAPQKIDHIGSLTPHDEIWIYGDEMFIEQAELEGWPGNGSPESPYIISDYYFNTWDKPLTVYHTTVHWVFTNNVIDGEDDHGGTWIQNCTNGAIINNEICNRRFGIAVAGGYGLNITDNNVHDCWENGIEFIAGMNNALVQNNVITNIGVAGFYSGLSHDSIIVNNTLSNCSKYGISLTTNSPIVELKILKGLECESRFLSQVKYPLTE